MVATVHINPALLQWARESAGLSREELADVAGIKGARGRSAEERIASWEAGENAPTRPQLLKLAKGLMRPVTTFYLPAPPIESDELPDFRTVANRPVDANNSVLKTFVRRMRARQDEILALLEDDDELVELPFIGSLPMNTPIEQLIASVRQTLDIPLARQMQCGDKDELFRLIRNQVEKAGIFVQIQGNLGSHHTNIDPDEFRGLALASKYAPFIVINGNDAKAAHTFTLLHEIAHLWLGESGLSNRSVFSGDVFEDGDIEAYCNRFAGDFLLPREQLLAVWASQDHGNVYQAVQVVARELNVSRAATAHRLWKLNAIEEPQWWDLYRRYQDEWKVRRERQKEQDGGPNYYVTTKSQLGTALISTVLGAVSDGSLSYTRASRILGVNPHSFDGLQARLMN
ncbi:ImmA/IrrE family metallo-endopeptidase [Marivibrio halodurans]|uniref:ImmA/IrrE family metallo-endopeptidase n=1 Tax=Marivibrio halodurans TaxID=2039722 RepID=A0A8J7S2K8_9PROT|nr:XRE family transcriptional regulator [Marivibrio halodurans]MBP5859130.1 ImmA/IrrE family metallo-endopeptidase [Marivibrio halodurans]